jgi:hypothetical protein
MAAPIATHTDTTVPLVMRFGQGRRAPHRLLLETTAVTTNTTMASSKTSSAPTFSMVASILGADERVKTKRSPRRFTDG